jgi:hypothetical protein
MAPGVLPVIRPGDPLEKGQTTIQAALVGGLSYTRPPRLGPAPKDSGRIINTILGRRLIGGDNEKFIQELFASVRISQAAKIDREPGDKDMMEGRILQDNDNGDTDYEPIKYYKYSCEYKLVVIEYFQIIWTVLNNGSH